MRTHLACLALFVFSSLLLVCNGRNISPNESCQQTIDISQGKTGQSVEGQPEYMVTMSNPCQVPQSDVTVKCFGLNSVETVDPNVIKTIDSELCLISQGQPIENGKPVSFKYAWKTPQDFIFVSSKV